MVVLFKYWNDSRYVTEAPGATDAHGAQEADAIDGKVALTRQPQ